MPQQAKLPPQDLEAEMSVLGAVMLDTHAIVRVADALEPADFYAPAHRTIYEVIRSLFAKGEPIDALTVTAELKQRGKLEAVGGSDYLADLIEHVPTSAHVERYARIVHEHRVRRDLMTASAEISERAMGEQSFDKLIDSVEQRIFALSQQSRTARFVHLKEELPLAYERVEKLHAGDKEGRLRGIPTGFDGLDNLLSGFQESDLIILGARPSVGKTALSLDFARNAALRGKKVGICSLEMSSEQIVDRIIAAQAQIPLWRIRTGRLNDDDFALIQHALGELSDTPLYIEDSPSPNMIHLRSLARKLQLEHGLDLLIIDYIQLIMPMSGSDNMVQQMTEISRGLKSLARELKTPVLALSQLSRAVEQRGDKPRLSDLRESGSIEQDADVVMLLHRRKHGASDDDVDDEEQNQIEVNIAKHRNGPLGLVKLYFDAEKVSFRTIDTHHMDTNF
ncbi:replicative DNA helicase [Candidatus Jorgensenbacteria bacterium GWA1_54_12]|uniref:Replicative DNA helicase n=1 Tax=Candidatus Jorgensenbacteria bacterium GWA1_54_12 TaxID=1798468 RepID=A0A1F6BLC0_9BACT|nr:MAG: replicative DNA helicase [Candidatus Jorgensenbacteria bacterium GWA1_54_12]